MALIVLRKLLFNEDIRPFPHEGPWLSAWDTKEQLLKEQEQGQGQGQAPGQGARGGAGRALHHAHHPGPGPVVGQRSDARRAAHDVVDIHRADRGGSEVGFEI